METSTLGLIIGAIAALGAALYFYLEYQARTLRTRVVDVPGGLRFEAHHFSVEVQRAGKQIVAISRTGRLARIPLAGGEVQVQAVPIKVPLPAAGLNIEVLHEPPPASMVPMAPISPGFCSVRIRATDAPTLPPGSTEGFRTELHMEHIPDIVAVSFSQFAARVRVWVEKIDHRLELERKARLRKEAEAAQEAEVERLLAEAQSSKAADQPLTDADREALAAIQIATWRKAAGFSGTATEVSIDAQGRVAWFVDVMDDGRITLHSDKRTIHSTLHGASVASLGGELEVGVRDDYWTEEDPALRIFRVFKGLSHDARRAWKERLELIRDSVTRNAPRGP